MAQTKAAWSDLDGIAVTIGPGLAGSLLVGTDLCCLNDLLSFVLCVTISTAP